jgi:hypothetical protein
MYFISNPREVGMRAKAVNRNNTVSETWSALELYACLRRGTHSTNSLDDDMLPGSGYRILIPTSEETCLVLSWVLRRDSSDHS